jgi:hypothetical protein
MIENQMPTEKILKVTNDKLASSGSFRDFYVGLFLLGLVLALPSGITSLFDGLPWTGGAETISLAVIIPFLLILGRKFLSLRIPILFLCSLLVLKSILYLGSPSSGWLIKLHPNLSKEQVEKYLPFQLAEGNSWVRTYATVWNEESSGILKKPWTEKLDFPLDWVLVRLPGCNKSKTQCWKGCSVSGSQCFDAISPLVEFEGALIVPEGKRFALIAEGVREGTLFAKNESNESVVVVPAKNKNEAIVSTYQFLEAGIWEISGKLKYSGTNWSLIPTLVDENGEFSFDLGRGLLWQNKESLSGSLQNVGFYKILSIIADGGVIIFLLGWLVWTTNSLIQKQFLNLPLASFSVLAIFSSIAMAPVYESALNALGTRDVTEICYLGFSLLVVAIGFLIFSYWKKDNRIFQADKITKSLFLAFGPAVLFHFSCMWWKIIGQWKIWGGGDDWVIYQFFARRIVVEGDWLRGGGRRFCSAAHLSLFC